MRKIWILKRNLEEENYDDESMDDLDSDDDLDDLVIIDSEEENDGELM